MIVAMSKFELTALSEERARLLAAMQNTRCVELTLDDQLPEESGGVQSEALSAQLSRVKKAIAFLGSQAEAVPDKNEALKGAMRDQIVLSYKEFLTIASRESELMEAVVRAEEASAALTERKSARSKLTAQRAQYLLYRGVGDKFSAFTDTRNTCCFFGLLEEAHLLPLESFLRDEPLATASLYFNGAKENVFPLAVFCHREAADRVAAVLTDCGFTRCPFRSESTAEEEAARLDGEIARLLEEEKEIVVSARRDLALLQPLKIFSDYLMVEIEKAEAAETFFRTKATFTARGYVPESERENVRAAIAAETEAYYLQFFAPTEEDEPPTLLKNRGPAKVAEFVTNMYSVPNYREFDPNAFVFFFFMVFFGVIMADIGYGALLFLGGLFVMRTRKANDGVRKLAAILTYGGIFTAIFGALFGSCFGFSLYTFLPDPSSGNRTNVLIILLGCLALGLLQITVGYALNAVNSIRKGHVLDAICDSFTWILFDVGLFFAVFNFITGYFEIPVPEGVVAFFDVMTLPGVIMLGVGLAGAALTAGRKEKIIGKFTKGFGAVYGVINLLSDVLSYARLFGLMLSGMIIAQQFNKIGVDLISSGAAGYAFGPVVIFIGHAFNLAMGVLGAYIHDCRLQYIEFFSKFYTGEGTLFTPLGSRVEYICFTE